MHELFESNRAGHFDSVVFNGHVDTIDPRTGQPVRPCLVTLRSTRDAFAALDLARVEPEACLKGLNAAVSKSPAELAPVRPVFEFAEGKPLELLSGSNLLYLLEEHASIQAKIEPPDDWADPATGSIE